MSITCQEEACAVRVGYAKHSKECGDNQLGQRKECVALLLHYLQGAGGGALHYRARESEENKIISLSDCPPLGSAH
jgi:hypothetical protein